MEAALSQFSNSNYRTRCEFLDNLILNCGLPELSYLHGLLQTLIRVDFITLLPFEVRETVFDFLDAKSIYKCKLVSRTWNSTVHESPSAHIVLMKGLGANLIWSQYSRNLQTVKAAYEDVIEAHFSLASSCGISKRSIEGHADRVCALHYANGMLSSCSYDGTARIANLKSGGSFERLIECAPSASIKTIDSGLISAQFNGDLRFHAFGDNRANLVFRAHTGAVNCFDISERKNLLVSGGADWKLITWRFAHGELIKVFSSHSAAVVELKLEEVVETNRAYASQGTFVLFSKDRNVCQVGRLEEPFDNLVVLKTLRSIDGHTYKNGMVINGRYLVLNTRLKVHLWCKQTFDLAHTVSCEHLLIPDLLGWGSVFGLMVDLFGLHVVRSESGMLVYSLSVTNLRKLDRTYTRFIAGEVEWLDGFTGSNSSLMLYACAMNNSFSIEVTSWLPDKKKRIAITNEDSQLVLA